MKRKIHTFIFLSDSRDRLDKFLVVQLPNKSRSQIQRLIKNGNVKVDDLTVTKTGYLLDKRGITVEITIPPPTTIDLQPENIPLDIIYEDDEVMVVNKPAGMVMHPAAGHANGTLVHAALSHASFEEGIGGKMRPGVVHRLDKKTSGVVILAKNEKTHLWLQNQFRMRKVKKYYVALVDKHPPTESGKIIAPIFRDRVKRKKMAIAPEGKGKKAVTIYRTLWKFKKYSFLEIQLLTGRTHQIRVHLASIGSPVTGDTVYGYSTPTLAINRHFLHARKIEIRLPGQKVAQSFNAELPDDLHKIINDLKEENK